MGEQDYLNLCKQVLTTGNKKMDRTKTGTYSLFGAQMRFNLQESFPLLTTKKVPFGLIKSELLWFLKGDTNIHYLLAHNNHIWDEWAFERYVNSAIYQGPDMTDFGHRALNDPEFKVQYDEEMKKFCTQILEDAAFAAEFGDLGNVYGKQWRAWQTSNGDTIDQIADVIEMIKTKPNSRRLIVTAWNPEDVPTAALPPCHSLFQFYVADGKLSCQLYQRSGDLFLGVPFNIASYALLTHLIADVTGLEVGEFVHTIGDAHLYTNHVDQMKEQLTRPILNGPKLAIVNHHDKIEDYEMDDIELIDYHSAAAIKAPVAV